MPASPAKVSKECERFLTGEYVPADDVQFKRWVVRMLAILARSSSERVSEYRLLKAILTHDR